MKQFFCIFPTLILLFLSLLQPAYAAPKQTVSSAVAREPWSYSVLYISQSQQLQITAHIPAGRVVVNNDGAAYIRDMAIVDSQNKITAETNSWIIPSCGKAIHLCTVRYTFELGALAERAGTRDDISSLDKTILSNPALWLLRPSVLPDEQDVTFRFEVKGAAQFATGLFPTTKDPNLYETKAWHLSDLPWTIFGNYHATRYAVKGATIDLAIIPAAYKVSEAEILAWSQRATTALVDFYQTFPVPHVLVIVVPRNLYNGPGKSFGDGGAVTVNPLSLKAESDNLKKDWVMTHEMVHLAFPSVPYRHHWIEEGLATYIEPIARLRSGELNASMVFGDMMEGMPKGLPAAGDQGLDGPPSWGRTYWGGALFCMLADVELLEKSKGKIGLETALRGINAKGGTMAVNWRLPETLAIADKATGYTVLSDLYKKMKDEPVSVDLPALWAKLGVKRSSSGDISFDDKAPLAFVRHAMGERR